MTEAELKALLSAEQSSALGYMADELSEERREAMDYYLGEPFGNEQEGRSSVVSTDVADTIEWILPALLKIFTASDETVRFDPQGPEDEAAAKQATEYVNYVFTRDNPGFLILYSLFKDALLQKNGMAKVWWEEKARHESRRLPGIPPEVYQAAAAQLEADGWQVETEVDEETGLHTLTATREVKRGKVTIVPVPPEEFMISRRARTIEDASYVAHRARKTVSELIEMGYDRETIEGLPSDEADLTDEGIARRQDIDSDNIDAIGTFNKAMRPIYVIEAYVRVDWDGDGIAEMRKITHAGPGAEILDNEPWDGPRPFVSLTPIIMPHRFFGLSIADLVKDLQLIKSTILRQMLDNLYLANNGRHAISDQVNLDDMLTSRPGGVVRLSNGAMPGAGHIMPLTPQPVVHQVFPVLEYIDSVRENRTGVTRYNQGIDANSLNKTATGISQIMTAAQQRTELIARIFAETGIKDLFGLILYLVRTHQEQERVIRLRNQWVPMAPATWPADFDLTISVGLGTGNRDMMAMHLTQIAGAQIQAVQLQGGASGPLVTMENLYNTGNKLAQALGFKEEGLFFTDPKNAQPQQPRPDPEMLKLQQHGQIEMAKLKQKDKSDTARLHLDTGKAVAELRLKQADNGAQIALQREKHGDEMTARREIAQASAKPPVSLQLNGQEVGEMASGLSQLIANIAQQQQAFMQRQAERDAKQDQMMAALATALAAPRQKTIAGKLPSGQSFQATVTETGNA